MIIRPTTDPAERLGIAIALSKLIPSLADPSFIQSIPLMVNSEAYNFWIATDDAEDEWTKASAFGILSFCEEPMAERLVLVVDAFWFAQAEVARQEPIWHQLMAFSRELNFKGVCIAEAATNTPEVLRRMAAEGWLDQRTIVVRARPYLQSKLVGTYSTLAGGPLPSHVFEAPCFRLIPFDTDFGGVVNTQTPRFYRGEGRLETVRWNCANFHELASYHREQGFWARAKANFQGAVQEQILQQGYVDQGTCSTSTNRDVAVYYATGGGSRPAGVVFELDGDTLRNAGPVYDAYRTMARDMEDYLRDELAVVGRVVRLLGVEDAGRFLNDCDKATRERVARGGGTLAGEPLRAADLLTGPQRGILESGGVDDKKLGSLFVAMEEFWEYGSGAIGSVEEIHIMADNSSQTRSRALEPMGYYMAFRSVERLLDESLQTATAEGRPAEYRQPGWDTTPFGYIAKTFRDAECFSTGPISGNCIVRAEVVDVDGNVTQLTYGD
jgi:hypothetical protein